jgi:formylglycine-generating enzyme required for sulfatase activity
MKNLTSVLFGFLAVSALAMPQAAVTAIEQDTGTRVVSVAYTLASGPAIVTFDVTTNGVAIGQDKIWSVRGDVNRLIQNGAHMFVWQPLDSWGDVRIADEALDLKINIRTWKPTNPPDYMAVSCSTYSNVFYYASAEALPGGLGATNGLFKSDWILMRRIHARNRPWRMGSSPSERRSYPGSRETPHEVTLTEDYYMGVFPVTQEQVLGFMPGYQYSCLTNETYLPMVNITWQSWRGNPTNAVEQTRWPTDGHNVGADSVLGCLRKLTGIAFDLPTDAQWEYACRAGTVSTFCCGYRAEHLADYAWFGGSDGGSSGVDTVAGSPYNYGVYHKYPFAVGQKKPNAWGLYDMHGNVNEWCLDWCQELLPGDPVVDPTGPVNDVSGSNYKVYRGGCYYQEENMTKSAYRNCNVFSSSSISVGARLCCPIADISAW